MRRALLPYPALLEVKVEPDVRLRAVDLILQARAQLVDLGRQAVVLVRRLQQLRLLQRRQVVPEFREVDFFCWVVSGW